MERFKGTKGGWYFKERFGSLEMYADRIAEYDVLCNFERSTASEDETKANALLMSKAPKMLEMLIYLIKDEQLCTVAMEDEVKQLIKEATEL